MSTIELGPLLVLYLHSFWSGIYKKRFWLGSLDPGAMQVELVSQVPPVSYSGMPKVLKSKILRGRKVTNHLHILLSFNHSDRSI